jgi:hypothetical protein
VDEMSIFGFLGGIFTKVWEIGAILLPILDAFRKLSPDVDDMLSKVDGIIDQGGEVADDFFDRNLKTLTDMREVYQDMAAVGATGEAFINEAILVSQVQTPDDITPQEAESVGRLLLEHKDALKLMLTSNEDLATALKAMQ